MPADELLRGGPALLDFFLLVQVAGGRQHDAADVAHGVFDGVLEGERRAHVVLRAEAAVHVARADAQLQHDGRVAGFGEGEPLFDRAHDGGQVGARVEQPHLRLHGEGVGAFLHDAGAFAVVFADDDERAARDAARRQVGQRVGCHVGADGGLERDGSAQRIVDRSGERGGGGGLRGAVFEVDAEILEDVVGVGEHVHEVGDGSALVAGDVRDSGLEEGLGDGEDALAMEFVALAQPELLDFLFEGAFRHAVPYFIPKWGTDEVLGNSALDPGDNRRGSGLGDREAAMGAL
ncbi:hypothetical protein SBA4_1840017 [Candidatus Sulfopaludibacter sp. SbA4]|nr:hypothetical protein SBA4_1840017 [Candidatus Sulfopaludibacter sp. SbA4]